MQKVGNKHTARDRAGPEIESELHIAFAAPTHDPKGRQGQSTRAGGINMDAVERGELPWQVGSDLGCFYVN